MKLYFLRHGDAVAVEDWKGEEAERPLSMKGEADMARVGERLSALGLSFERALTSPYARARRSAELALAAMVSAPALAPDDRLMPGFGIKELAAILSEAGGASSLLVVGHEPDFSRTISSLVGGARIEIKKGALARVDLVPGEARATLELLIPPSLLR